MRRVRRRLVVLGILGSLLVIGVVVYAVVALTRSIPHPTLTSAALPKAFPGRLSGVAWPAVGESALAVRGVGFIGTHGGDRPLAIASVAKIMTAYLVLRDHPLSPGEDGPVLTITPADVTLWRADLALDQSTVEVKAGEQLTERQALEALMLPSADNMATLLAQWDAGSEASFVNKMNAQARAMGLTGTHYADASGFDPATVSTASDQVRLALAAIRVPAFASIVATREVTLPVVGVVQNLDALLGSNGVVGIKTGTTTSAGGCFVLAARLRVGRRIVTVAGAVMGQPATSAQPTILDAALHAAALLARSVPHVLKRFGVVARGRTFAWIHAPWTNHPVPVRAASAPPLVGWSGLPVTITVVPELPLTAPVQRGQQVAYATVKAGRQRARMVLVAARSVPRPSLGWRLTHP